MDSIEARHQLGQDDLTVADVLRVVTRLFAAHGLDSPAVDARLLLARALNATSADLIREPSRALTVTERATVEQFVDRRLAREPVSRIVGCRSFYGREFEVTEATLDPRPDSETLIEAALQIVHERGWRGRPIRILDIGTGTGCLLITLLAELPNATGVGVDLSSAALMVAQRNGQALGVADRADFVEGDGFETVTDTFDLVVSNPPYIPSADIAALDPEVRIYDPRLALDGGGDGLNVYRALRRKLIDVVPNGAIVVEVGAGQADAVGSLLSVAAGPQAAPFRTWTDLGGHVRCVAISTQSQPSH
jgi:release factor glutamine methyltransferase